MLEFVLVSLEVLWPKVAAQVLELVGHQVTGPQQLSDAALNLFDGSPFRFYLRLHIGHLISLFDFFLVN